MVEYSADFYILKPVDVTKGNGALFYELANRGNRAFSPASTTLPAATTPRPRSTPATAF
jgi:hypothetical protein